MTQEYTAHYRLPIPDFNTIPWHQAWEDSLRAVDEALYLNTVSQAPMWTNSTVYTVTDLVLDPLEGTLWTCLVNHTSPGTPTTFAQYRAANPTHWQGITTLPTYRGEWVTGTTYNKNDFVHSGTKYAVAIVAHVAGASFAADEAGGKWTTLIDVGSSTIAINGEPYASVAAAANLNLGSVSPSRVIVTGTFGNITDLGATADLTKILVMGANGNTFVHNGTKIVLPDSVNIAAEAGDVLIFSSNSTNVWTLLGFLRKTRATAFGDIKQAASTTATGVVELATDAEAQAKTDATRALTPLNLAALAASLTFQGLIEIATDGEALLKADATRALSPANLAALGATTAFAGLVELATGAEALALTDATRAITPSTLGIVVATETQKGILEIATGPETAAMFDMTRAVAPGGLASLVASTGVVGLVRYATAAETKAFVVSTAAVTPDGLGQTLATETQKGLIEIATDAEVAAKTDTTRAVTPSGLAQFTASTTIAGFVELATAAEAQAMSDTGRGLTPSNLTDVTGSRTQIEAELALNRFPLIAHLRYAPGAAKAYGFCDSGGTLLAGYNISVINDGGVGIVQVGIDADFANVNHVPLCMALGAGADRFVALNTAPTVGSFNALCWNAAGAASDPTRYYFADWGLQA